MTPAISHLVDTIEDEKGEDEKGEVAEEYNYLVYAFGRDGDVIARTYLDDIRRVSVFGRPTPEIMAYLQERFTQIDRLGKRG